MGAGEAVRIFTGAVVPEGADTIVIQEDTDAEGNQVTINESRWQQRQAHPRARGWISARATCCCRAGVISRRAMSRCWRRAIWRKLRCAASPRIAVRRHRRRTVAARREHAQTRRHRRLVRCTDLPRSSRNGAARRVDLGILPDTTQKPFAALPSAPRTADLIVTLGGASVGDHDLVQSALGPQGFALDFWKIAMRPGKPLIFGRLGRRRCSACPAIRFRRLSVRAAVPAPAIAAMLGEHDLPAGHAQSEAQIAAQSQRRTAGLSARAHRVWRDGEWLFVESPSADPGFLRC